MSPLEALRLIHDWRGLCDEDRLHAWERIGADFYRDTGYLRPGKDEPMGFETPDAERADAWKAWTAEQNARIDAALREALAGPVTVTVGPTPEPSVRVSLLTSKTDEWDREAEAYESVHLARCADDLRRLVAAAESEET